MARCSPCLDRGREGGEGAGVGRSGVPLITQDRPADDSRSATGGGGEVGRGRLPPPVKRRKGARAGREPVGATGTGRKPDKLSDVQ